jgi:hypothetical protein
MARMEAPTVKYKLIATTYTESLTPEVIEERVLGEYASRKEAKASIATVNTAFLRLQRDTIPFHVELKVMAEGEANPVKWGEHNVARAVIVGLSLA